GGAVPADYIAIGRSVIAASRLDEDDSVASRLPLKGLNRPSLIAGLAYRRDHAHPGGVARRVHQRQRAQPIGISYQGSDHIATRRPRHPLEATERDARLDPGDFTIEMNVDQCSGCVSQQDAVALR